MELKEYISGLSVLLSAFVVYNNFLRGARYVSPPMRWIAFGFLPNSKILVINFPISIANTGSQTGVIDSFYIELVDLKSRKSENFYAWQEGSFTDLRSGISLEKVPGSVTLKAGEGQVREYIFVSDSLSFMYALGTYRVILYAYLVGKKKPVCLFKQNLEIVDLIEPSSIPNTMPFLFSYNLFPKKVLKVSNYGQEIPLASLIEISKS